MACQRIRDRAASEEEAAKLHNQGSVLRSANPDTDRRLFLGAHRSAWNHLLDTHLHKAHIRVLQPDSDVAAADSSFNRLCRDARQWLALRPDRRAALAHCHTSFDRLVPVLPFDCCAPRCTLCDLVPAARERDDVRLLSNILGHTDDDAGRGGGRRYVRTDQLARATRWAVWKLHDRRTQ